MTTEYCAYCGSACENENPYEWRRGEPFCSEACFEAWRDEDEELGDA